MKHLLILAAFFVLGTNANSQDFSSFFSNGRYHFNDETRLLKSEIFTIHKSKFGITSNNVLVLQSEGLIDTNGYVGGKYKQKCNGHSVEGTMVNVISKYGIVSFVNGFFYLI